MGSFLTSSSRPLRVLLHSLLEVSTDLSRHPEGPRQLYTEMFLLFLGSLGQSPIVARVPSGEANTCLTHEIAGGGLA